MPVVGERLINVSYLFDRIVQPFTEVSSTKASTTTRASIHLDPTTHLPRLPPPVLLGLPRPSNTSASASSHHQTVEFQTPGIDRQNS
ncbi:hypothetical protein BYT27DRAFT_7183205, partial [Phlegmacium glaucopus]